ncbi:putative phage tail assembly chaperone [Providencia rettgeri]|uniref:Phage tail assembly chaperone n=2 Tax=Providencia TaxID=586 RepID=A0AAE2ZDK1_PRORE|nr:MULTISPECIES: putative phage tail assembly chaperone [Providencia]EHZ6871924.1 putative phage tail assembly chaperone [Providencia rettgeri]EJD6476446.1 putative phage tail assembly chaperone [Providencia rettgeri]EJD6581548.1 putative phage tail assembly chaperone [Providencia rettgeri]ELM3937715.1 putative phage tail assembly chaperone [Providencia rettgeri]ELR5064190.1 putative phage tail assembly chaperone [Providencia rettgeri]
MTKKIITLTINEKDVSFEPNITAYNGMINDMSMDNKVAPLTTYLKRIVTAESKEYLDELLSFPGAAAQLAEAVNKEYAPKLEISVKN